MFGDPSNPRNGSLVPLLALVQRTGSDASNSAFECLIHQGKANTVEEYLALSDADLTADSESIKMNHIRSVLRAMTKGQAPPEDDGTDLALLVPVLMAKYPDLLTLDIVVSSLLQMKCGDVVISAVIGLMPWSAMKVVARIASSLPNKQAENMLIRITDDWPECSIGIRSLLNDMKVGSDVIVTITLKSVHDEVEYFSRRSIEWFWTGLSHDGAAMKQLRRNLSLSSGPPASLLYVWCMLYGLCSVTPSQEETLTCLKLIKMVASTDDARIGVCALLLCPLIAKNTDVSDVATELLVCVDAALAAIHLSARITHPISTWLSRVLGCSVSVDQDSLKMLADVLVPLRKRGDAMAVWDEHHIVQRAVKFPVEQGLSADKCDSNALVVMFHLHNIGAFRLADPSHWILKQIQASVLPIHPLLAALVDGYSTEGGSGVSQYRPISRQVIKKIAVDPSTHDAAKILLLAHIMTWRTAANKSKNGIKIDEQSDVDALDALGVGRIVASALDSHASLVGSVVVHVPQALVLQSLVMRQDMSPTTEPFPEQVTDLAAICRTACNATLPQIKHAATVITQELVPVLLAGDMVNGMRFTRAWQALAAAAPGSVAPSVALVFAKLWNLGIDNKSVINALTASPLSLLKCDIRVFRCPPVLGLWLHIFQFVLASSRHMAEETSNDAVMESCLMQEVAAVQMLLDACHERDGDELDRGTLSSIRHLICSHVHAVFIESPVICRMLHTQGYSPSILPITVAGIPSMHICLGFLPELINDATPSLMDDGNEAMLVFYILLTAELSKAYPIPNSLEVCNLAMQALSSLSDGFLRRSVPGLCIMCRVFPKLTEDAIRTLGTHSKNQWPAWRQDAIKQLCDESVARDL